VDAKSFTSDILKKYEAILIFPEPDSTLHAPLIAALSAKTLNFAVLSATDVQIKAGKLIKTTPEMIDEIISLYSLYRFTDKLIIASFSLPYGQKLQNLYYNGFITIDDYADIMVHRL
jgi:hypothetical protein